MTDTDKLAMLKIDLGITNDHYDERLRQYLKFATDEIKREGIKLLADNLSDDNLQIMYAAWMWRKRQDGDDMPRMLRRALNNRLMSQKMKRLKRRRKRNG